MGKLTASVSTKFLFPQKPTIAFYPQVEICPHCGAKLLVLKTQIKTVVTMHIGAFQARETILQCPHDQTVFTSTQLRSLVPDKGTFGFDVIECVGIELFVHCRNTSEIIKKFAQANIFISEREISYLGKKFIVYLALAHRESGEQLRRSMNKRGGYILHLDGTCESDSPHLFCGLDGISELVLDNIKIPSEKKELLIPFFQRIKEQYGTPVALVHDMAIGILRAVEEVFPGVPDFICHFHFLRDIGKDLLLQDYQAIIKGLRKHNVRSLLKQKARYLEKKIDGNLHLVSQLRERIENGELKALKSFSLEKIPMLPTVATYVLIHWAFEAPRQSKGYGFPFDRPHLEFYHRLRTIYLLLTDIIDIQLKGNETAKYNRPFKQVWSLLHNIFSDKVLSKSVASLQTKAIVFDKLRDALRIAPMDGKNGLNDEGNGNGEDETNIRDIEEKVNEFRNWLINNESRKRKYSKMIEQMDKYWDKLFAAPILVYTTDESDEPIVIVPQRTNNILERFFRGEKRDSRKKSGTASVSKILKTILADTPLVKNLGNDEYYKTILNGCSTLAERFSQIEAKLVQKHLKEAQSENFISPEVKKIVKLSNLPEKISALLKACSKI